MIEYESLLLYFCFEGASHVVIAYKICKVVRTSQCHCWRLAMLTVTAGSVKSHRRGESVSILTRCLPCDNEGWSWFFSAIRSFGRHHMADVLWGVLERACDWDNIHAIIIMAGRFEGVWRIAIHRVKSDWLTKNSSECSRMQLRFTAAGIGISKQALMCRWLSLTKHAMIERNKLWISSNSIILLSSSDEGVLVGW